MPPTVTMYRTVNRPVRRGISGLVRDVSAPVNSTHAVTSLVYAKPLFRPQAATFVQHRATLPIDMGYCMEQRS